MTASIKPPRKCVLAVGGLASLLLIVGMVLVWPLISQNGAFDKQMEARSEQLTRYRTLEAERPRLRSTLQRLKRSAGQTRYYVSADTSALGAAELQKLVKQIIESHGGELTSTQALPVQDDGNTVRIAIRVRMKLKMDYLADVLHRLESGRPLLFVENLSIRSQKRRAPRRQSKQSPRVNYVLDIRYDLVGYMREATG